jgi:hypothetical protein
MTENTQLTSSNADLGGETAKWSGVCELKGLVGACPPGEPEAGR